jgi:hypothetical protein
MIRYDLERLADDDLFMPRFWCDACGRPIEGQGNVYWLVDLDTGEIYPQIWHTHKHPCARIDRDIEELTGGFVMSEELDVHISQLTYNFKQPRKETTP